MRVTATYLTMRQAGPESLEEYTRVVHLEPQMTLLEAYNKITSGWVQVQADLQFHFDLTDKEAE